eukprot:9323854-Alexandrium_andersonii.AAC.1
MAKWPAPKLHMKQWRERTPAHEAHSRASAMSYGGSLAESQTELLKTTACDKGQGQGRDHLACCTPRRHQMTAVVWHATPNR